MSEWIETKIDALTTDIIDCVNKTAPKVPYETPYKMIRTTNVKDGRLDVSEVNFVEEGVFKKWTRRGLLEKNDILLTREAPLGEVARITNEKNYFLGQRIMMYRPDPQKVDPDFLFYAMLGREVKHQIKAFGMGSTVEHMRVPDCSEIVIKHPKDTEEQSCIGKTLSNLDQKITLLRQQNQTLEEVAQTLFKRWFVEFEFPNENGEPYKSSGGKMVESELGEIPEGWRVGVLSDIIELTGGGTPKTTIEAYWGGDICWYSVVDVPSDGDCFVVDTEKKITQKGLENSSTKLLRKGTTIISARGTVGKLAITGLAMAMNQSCYGVNGKNSYGDFTTFFQLNYALKVLKRRVHGAVFDTITKATFDGIEISISTPETLMAFEVTIKPIMKKILCNVNEIQTLTQLRDTLLPKLMSGELRVKNQIKLG
jgi:type I restriction enzyme S subunit